MYFLMFFAFFIAFYAFAGKKEEIPPTAYFLFFVRRIFYVE